MSAKTRLSAEEREAIRKLAESGAAPPVIAARFGRSPSTIYDVLKGHGWVPVAHDREWTERELEVIREQAAAGRRVGYAAHLLRRRVPDTLRKAEEIGVAFVEVERVSPPKHLPSAVAERNYGRVAERMRFEDVRLRPAAVVRRSEVFE